MVNVLGWFELTGGRTARERAAVAATQLADVRAALARERSARERVEQERAAASVLAKAATARADEAAHDLAAARAQQQALCAVVTDSPPAMAGELIAMADRVADLGGPNLPTDAEQVAALLRWLRGRTDALLAMCEVAPIVDDGALDFMRHEVVADRPAPRADLVDHIADTVRPGYRWRNDLLRPQQVVAYIAP